MKNIYVLWHECQVSEIDNYYDKLVFFGLFSSYRKAHRIKNKYMNHPDFVKNQEGFSIDKCVINQKGWAEGFNSFDSDK